MDRNHLVQHTSADGVAVFGVAPSGDVSMSSLGADIAARFTKLKPGHLEQGARDTQPPSALSPVFHGSFGWHATGLARIERATRPGRADCALLGIRLDDNRLRWHGGSAEIDRLIDLDPLVAGPGESEIVGGDAARQLTSPVLADYDASEGEWLACQHLPLWDERLVVRKLPGAVHLFGAQSTFETILNVLTSA